MAAILRGMGGQAKGKCPSLRIHVYRAAEPDVPTTYTRGQAAEAEPAAPGWRVAVDWVFAGPDLVIPGRLG
jgi:hypothetical protein